MCRRNIDSGGDHLFSGLIRYYELSGDWPARDKGAGIAERLIPVQNEWRAWVRDHFLHLSIGAWITAAFARLYGLTGEQRYLDYCGFVALEHEPLPAWSYFDEGPGARVAVGRTPVHVPVRFPGGEEQVLWFTPLCYNTSCLSYYETPIVFSRERETVCAA